MRLIKHNRIIHLQIQEGKLLPYGYIDNSTVRWVPVDDFKITDPGVRSGKDYHTMTYEQRELLLDELAPHEPYHVVTGMELYKAIKYILVFGHGPRDEQKKKFLFHYHFIKHISALLIQQI